MDEAEGQCSTHLAPSADDPLLDCLGQRRRGRPPTTPAQRLAMFRTFVQIDSWRRTALSLAQRDVVPAAELEKILTRAKVPLELSGPMRAVIGRHRPYRDAPGLTDGKQRRLGTLAMELDSKPREQWTECDRRKDQERARLMAKLHGKATIKKIAETILGGTSAPGIVVHTRHVTPVSLRRLWRAFDEWGARQHGVAVKTFRDWRRTLQRSDDPLFRSLRRKVAAKPQRHRLR